MDQLKYDLQQKEEEALLDDEMQVETHTKVGKIVPIDAAPSPPTYPSRYYVGSARLVVFWVLIAIQFQIVSKRRTIVFEYHNCLGNHCPMHLQITTNSYTNLSTLISIHVKLLIY